MAQPVKTAARAAESKFRNRQEEQQLETAGMMRWLLTYADMITLMLALFIILFALESISSAKPQEYARSVTNGFDNIWAVNQPPNGGTNGARAFDSSSAIPSIQRELENFVRKNHLEKQLQVRLDHRGLVITLLSDNSYYDSGSAELRPQTRTILDGVFRFLKRTPNLVRVEGNTDTVPIHTSLYPTNWELSTARAVNVVRYLVEHDGLDPVRVSAAGYGEFKPRVQNDSDENRQQNRRVDIVLLNSTISNAEKGL